MTYILKRFEPSGVNGKLVGFDVTIPHGPTRYFESAVDLPFGQNLSDNDICYLAYKLLKDSIEKWVLQEKNGNRQSISLGSEFIPPNES